ncbi:hypothetical protein [Andreprevotia chitinilytica]|uniref:hypothetical protein n=1 Tax=Andreprevotia chitinilytica TaxID=396808 RepID=UPI00054CFD7E|nr:hypothetical protein [Andreprevotia chitinilytica]
MEEKFDLICKSKFRLAEDRFSRLCRVDPVGRLIGADQAVGDDGFLGVSLSIVESLWLAKALKRLGVDVYPVAERYKVGHVPSSEAMKAAQHFVADERVRRPELNLADAVEISLPWPLSATAYGFISKSEEMKRDDIAPAGITISVDRVGGNVLQPYELLDFELKGLLIE